LQKADLPLGRQQHYAVIVKGKMTSHYVTVPAVWLLLLLLLQVQRATCQLDSGNNVINRQCC